MPLETELPTHEKLNIPALSSLFKSTTTSYKFLSFLSLLEILKRRGFDVTEPISLDDLIVEMLTNAWFPHTFFKLSFGTNDKLTDNLDQLDLDIVEPVVRFQDGDNELLRNTIAEADFSNAKQLMRYVPFRLLCPFLDEELVNVDRGRGNELERAMPTIANKYFEIKNPLYKFDSDNYYDCKEIYFNKLWGKYLGEHYKIIHGWLSWNWLHYMQRCNPSTPGLSNKLFSPVNRASITNQRNYWREILINKNGTDIRCIYSGAPLSNDFSLDHYLPWSFVAHDQLWNLIPTSPEINSSKSNKIPASTYFDGFVKIQHQGLNLASHIFSDRKFSKISETFLTDLPLTDISDLLDYQKLYVAYQQSIDPLIILAKNQGFSDGWTYKS